MLDPLISVIIPVYNTEEYLSDCLESLLVQSYRKLEIIIIDDGSTDLSYKICKLYENQDHRIRLYKKCNEGQSKARNMGIDLAGGEWIYFMDSDDRADRKLLEKLVKNALLNESEISMCGYYRQDENKVLLSYKYNIETCLPQNKAIFYLGERIIDDFLWNKLFKRELFENIRFDESLSAYEDMEIMHKVFCKVNKLCYVNENLYFYRKRIDSTMEKQDFNKKVLYFVVQKRRFDYIFPREIILDRVLFHSLVISLMSVYKFCMNTGDITTNYGILNKYYSELNKRKDYSSLATLIFTISDRWYIKAVKIGYRIGRKKQ